MQFRTYPNRLGNTPLYFSLESSVSHLLTTGLINGPEANYYRADAFPTLSLQLRTPPWLSIRPQISARQTYYSSSLDEASAKVRTGPPLDDEEDLALPVWAGVVPLRLVAGAPVPDPALAASNNPAADIIGFLERFPAG